MPFCCAEIPVDKLFGAPGNSIGSKPDDGIERTFSLRKRMSAFPRVDTDVNENLNGPLSSFLQQNEISSSMSGMFDL